MGILDRFDLFLLVIGCFTLAFLFNRIRKRKKDELNVLPLHKKDELNVLPLHNKHADLFSYLDILYNDVGLFIQQYVHSDNSYNSEKSQLIHKKMEEFVPLHSKHKLFMSDKLNKEVTDFFDLLFHYKRRLESSVVNKSPESYERWLKINTDYSDNVKPALEHLNKKSI